MFMGSNIQEAIKSALIDLLVEKSAKAAAEDAENPSSEKPGSSKKSKSSKMPSGTISTKGAFGSGGRAKRFVAAAKARADKDPSGLLKDLGVKDTPSGTDSEKALSIINQSIHNNNVMSQAYLGATIKNAKSIDGEVINSAIVITMRELDRKNGVRFMANTLEAAVNAQKLRLTGGLQFAQSVDKSILVYPV